MERHEDTDDSRDPAQDGAHDAGRAAGDARDRRHRGGRDAGMFRGDGAAEAGHADGVDRAGSGGGSRPGLERVAGRAGPVCGGGGADQRAGRGVRDRGVQPDQGWVLRVRGHQHAGRVESRGESAGADCECRGELRRGRGRALGGVEPGRGVGASQRGPGAVPAAGRKGRGKGRGIGRWWWEAGDCGQAVYRLDGQRVARGAADPAREQARRRVHGGG